MHRLERGSDGTDESQKCTATHLPIMYFIVRSIKNLKDSSRHNINDLNDSMSS